MATIKEQLEHLKQINLERAKQTRNKTNARLQETNQRCIEQHMKIMEKLTKLQNKFKNQVK